MTDIEIKDQIEQSPCKIEILFNDLGMLFFECSVHSTYKEDESKGDHGYEKVSGTRLQTICRQRMRKRLAKLMAEESV